MTSERTPTSTVDGKTRGVPMAAKFYVRRTSRHNAAGISYVGPVSERDAQREVSAWEAEGETCEVIPVTKETRAEVRRWEKITHADDARMPVTFQGEPMTLAAYRLNHENA